MKKYLKIDRNEFVFLEILYMLEFYDFDNTIKNEINKIRNLVEKKVFDDFFKDNGDILNEECILCYTFEK